MSTNVKDNVNTQSCEEDNEIINVNSTVEKDNKSKNIYNSFKNILSFIFSLENSYERTHKIITFLGLKLKIKRKSSDIYLNKILHNTDVLLYHNSKKYLSSFEEINKINRVVQTALSTCFLHQKTFPQFKGIHENKEIVIVASGISAEEYKYIDGAIHIGVNRAFQIGNYRIPMDYMFVQDFSGKTKEYIDDLDNYKPDTCKKFYGLTNEFCYDPERTIPEFHAIKANALRYRTDWTGIPHFESKFAYDISVQPLGCFASIVFPALQFALWTHPKRIYLVGCDCTTSGYAYNKNETNFLYPDEIVIAYQKFKQFAQKYYPDVEIISINPVGLKGLFQDIYQ